MRNSSNQNRQQAQFNNGISKCWQAATILQAMSKSRLQEMDGLDVSVALEGVYSILHSALCDMEDLDFNRVSGNAVHPQQTEKKGE